MAKSRGLYSYAKEGNYIFFGNFQSGVYPGVGEGADWNKISRYSGPVDQATIAGYGTPEFIVSPLTTKGDIFIYDTADARLAVGADGKYLKADSTTTSGLLWATNPSPWETTSSGGITYIIPIDETTNRVVVGGATVPSSSEGEWLRLQLALNAGGAITDRANLRLTSSTQGGSETSSPYLLLEQKDLGFGTTGRLFGIRNHTGKIYIDYLGEAAATSTTNMAIWDYNLLQNSGAISIGGDANASNGCYVKFNGSSSGVPAAAQGGSGRLWAAISSTGMLYWCHNTGGYNPREVVTVALSLTRGSIPVAKTGELGLGTIHFGGLALGASGKLLRSDGTDLVYSTFTIPDTFAINTIPYASSANTLAALAAANSSVLVSGGTGVPSMSTDLPTAVTIGGAYIYRVGGTDVSIADGGTNSSTALNNSRIMVSSAGAIVEAGAMTNGQLLIGSSGAAPVVATLTAGSNITITNAAGAITIAATGGSSPLTTKGDIFGYDTGSARVPVGTDGQALFADSTDTQGVAYYGTWRKLATVTANNDATVDFGNYFTTTYKSYALVVSNAVPATDAVDAYIRLSDDDGATYEADASDYQYANFNSGAGISGGRGGTASYMELINIVGSDTGEGLSVVIMIFNPKDTTINKYVGWHSGTYEVYNGVHWAFYGGGQLQDTVAVEGIRFLFSSGNVESGVFELYGIS